LPLAALEAQLLTYFLTHPEMLEVRDSALEAQAIFMVVKYSTYLLVPTAISAICVLLLASREGKAYAAILMAAFCVAVYLTSLGGQFAFNSWQRVYLESIPVLVLFVLAVAFLIRRAVALGLPLPRLKRSVRE
jgi:spore maturation protein SpmA